MEGGYTILSFPKAPIDKKVHMQRWVRTCFPEKLKKEGFISYQDEDLSWYKVINGEVLLTVYLYTDAPIPPMFPLIGYGMHPLFIPAPVPQKVVLRGWADNEVMTRVYFDFPMVQFDRETYVLCTDSPERGAEKLDEVVFPLFSKIHTIEDAYLHYKDKYLQEYRRRPSVVLTRDFMDMAIYLDDIEMYEICLNSLKHIKKVSPKDEPKRTDAQIAAIEGGQREAYLQVLEMRKKRFVRTLENKLGLTV